VIGGAFVTIRATVALNLGRIHVPHFPVVQIGQNFAASTSSF
jgi:hypothetical protein